MKAVEYQNCPCGKRGFANRQRASKALGRARTKRNRNAHAQSRRGMVRENRVYACPDSGLLHLTHMSRREVTAGSTATVVGTVLTVGLGDADA